MAEYDRINRELQQLQAQIIEKQWVEKQLNEIRTELLRQQELSDRLQQQLAKEQEDVKSLENLSLTGLFYSLLGNKDRQLEKERQEALRMQLEYDEARRSLSLKEADLRALQRRRQQIDEAEKTLEATLEIKLSLLLSASGAVAQKLKKQHEQGQALKKEKQEVGEVLEAAKAYQQLLETLIKQLRSAKDWGTWDVLGGGMLSSYVKQQRLKEVRKTVTSLQHYESNFRRELADVSQSGALSVEINGFEGVVDVFFDNLITDWIVQQRIHRSLASAQKACDEVVGIVSILKVKYQQIGELIEREEAALRKEIIAVK